MRIARVLHNGNPRYAIVEAEQLKLLANESFESLAQGLTLTDEVLPLAETELLAPVQPGKLVCVGLNYQLHAKESGVPVPEEPMLFMCSPEAIVAEGQQIELDSLDQRIDFEAEIAIVIGRQARRVGAGQALDYVYGYTCANDVSNRDLQRKDGQFTRAKSFDTYKPLGPWIETEIDPSDLSIQLWQNGELRQSSRTSDMIFPIPKIVAFVSGIMTLKPGDVILTGTPSGVGPMAPGDRIEMEIEGIGRLSNTVIAPQAGNASRPSPTEATTA